MGLGFLLWLWWFKAWAVVELVHLDFLVEVVVLVEGYSWVWIFDSFGLFGGGCGCVKVCWWWWWLWLWIFGFVVGGGGAWLMVMDEGFVIGGGGARFRCSWV